MKRESSGNRGAGKPQRSSSAPRKRSTGTSAKFGKSDSASRPKRTDSAPRSYKSKTGDDRPARRTTSSGSFDKKPYRSASGDDRPARRPSSGSFDKKPYRSASGDDRPARRPSSGSFDKKPYRSASGDDRPARRPSSGSFDKKPYRSASGDDRPARRPSSGSFDKKPYRSASGDDRPARRPSSGSFDKKPYRSASGDDRPARRPSSGSFDKKPYRSASGDERPARRPNSGSFEKRPYTSKSGEDKPTRSFGPKKSFGSNRESDKPARAKKGYGRSDSFESRKELKSIHDKEEVKGRGERGGSYSNAGKGKFTKKSELKGFKPVGSGNDAEEDFRFKKPGSRGKKIDLGADEKFVSKTKSQSKERLTENQLTAGESIRLNRFISNAGVCSRREADELIGAGLVSINSTVVTELGTKVNAGDVVRFNGEKLTVEAKVYIILNKPKDAITTSDDPDGRNTVMDIFEGKLKERIFPVGRLDRNTTGVLLLTNDGELAQRLMHPKYEIKKVYKATLNKQLKPADLWNLSNGIELEDGFIKPDAIAQPDPKFKEVVGIEIHSGKNHIIHRMFEHMGYLVDRLDRALYAGLEKGKLKRGEWRELTDKELKALKKSVHLK